MDKHFQELKEDINETLLIIKICVTSFWFWLPVLYASYVFFQYWMFVYVHPLTLFILPAVLIIYLLIQEEKRVNATYGIAPRKSRRPFYFTILGGEHERFDWDLEKAIEEYEKIIKQPKDEENSIK